MDEYRKLADDMSAHMGKANFDAVLKDCHAGSLAIRELIERLESAEKALEAAKRAAELSLFVIRKQNVMPNSSWESGFNRDMEAARAHMEKYHGR